jgi:hypothetical protein
MDDLVQWLRAQLDEDERIARAASGGTVVGESGSWKPTPGGDEWEASRTDCDEDELLVALRPGLPRPPQVMSGLWGAVVSFRPEFEDPGVSSPLPQFQHAARHDPARVLREVDAKRRILDAYENYDREAPELDVPDSVVRLLALPYADRPGYRDDWRP